MNRFHDKVALITGAAQGIGRRVAERMATEGAKLILVDRSELVHELAERVSSGLQHHLPDTVERVERLDQPPDTQQPSEHARRGQRDRHGAARTLGVQDGERQELAREDAGRSQAGCGSHALHGQGAV